MLQFKNVGKKLFYFCRNFSWTTLIYSFSYIFNILIQSSFSSVFSRLLNLLWVVFLLSPRKIKTQKCDDLWKTKFSRAFWLSTLRTINRTGVAWQNNASGRRCEKYIWDDLHHTLEEQRPSPNDVQDILLLTASTRMFLPFRYSVDFLHVAKSATKIQRLTYAKIVFSQRD